MKQALLVCLSLLLSLNSCVHQQAAKHDVVRFAGTERRSGLPSVIVFVPPDAKLENVVVQLRDELEADFNVTVVPTTDNYTDIALAQALKRERFDAVVLVNNSTARAYRRWAHNQRNPPVAVILMASFAEDLQRTIPRSVGIAYEVPVVTSVVGLRSLGTSVKRIGVVHRAGFSDYVHTQARLAAVEHITFISEVLPEDPDVRDLKAALVRLKRAGADSLWLPNDNALLTKRLLTKAWLPYLERLELPVIVGVPSLVSADVALGVFGAIPDPEAMALQAADLLFELYDADWELPKQGVRLPLSVRTYVAKPLAAKFGMKQEALANVDVVVGGQEKVKAGQSPAATEGDAL